MIILKWYSIILLGFSTLVGIFKSGKNDENFLALFISFLIMLPVFVYLILS